MLNLFTKTKPWMVASLIAATSVFGKPTNSQCAPPCAPVCPPKPCPKPCPQPCPPTQVCNTDPCCPDWPTPVLNAAYNYPARVQTRCPWDIYVDASFIYWQPVEENLEVGFANTTVQVAGAFPTGTSGSMVNMGASYKPGFKVGLGGNFDYDSWDTHLEYTWFHNTNSQSSTQVAGSGQLFRTQGNPFTAVTNNFYDSVSSKWHLKMDIADWDVGRWGYVGTKLTYRPSVGVRADWIRQSLNTTYTRAAAVGGAAADVDAIRQKTSSWAIGPKVGLDSNWNLGAGFRFFGNGEADLLFTKYTRLSFRETHSAAVATPFSVKQKRVYAVKPHLDLELGFGWGMYFDCNNWYMDIALGYEFQVFFDQNMFRHFNDDVMSINSTLPNGNLYLQGLTAQFRLDF